MTEGPGGVLRVWYFMYFECRGQFIASVIYQQGYQAPGLCHGSVARLEGHTGCVSGVAFLPDSQLIASASDDRTVGFWDSTSRTLCGTLSADMVIQESYFSLAIAYT